MGGWFGEIRGSSKAETYRKYADYIENGYAAGFGSHQPLAEEKKLCKSLMKQDPVTGDWVLRYRVDK